MIRLIESNDHWSVFPASLNFGGDASANSSTFSIQNNTARTANRQIEKSSNWIVAITPQSGTLSAKEKCTIKVDIDRTALSQANTQTTLRLTAGDNVINISVKASLNSGDPGNPDIPDTPKNGWEIVKKRINNLLFIRNSERGIKSLPGGNCQNTSIKVSPEPL